jgi:shikimate dehydrogenase
MTARYAVMGHPVAHSKSPAIHGAFARQTGQDLVYRAIHVPPGTFAGAVAEFRRQGGSGLNVTLPYKEEAWALCQRRTRRAELALAANTLWFEAAGIHGDNTDGVGLVRDLTANLGLDPGGRRILLLGAGGAARGVVAPLLGLHPRLLVIANRTAARALELAARFAGGGALRGCGLEALAGEQYDLAINATSASLQGELPPLPPGLLAPGAWCYDMMYADRATPFVLWGLEHGAAGAVDGLGMLVEQAAEAFLIWRGVRPDTAPVITGLRAGTLG